MRTGRSVADVRRRADSGAVLLFAVPALMLVVLGYVVGYTVIEGVVGATGAHAPPSAPEVGGWITGLVLVAVATAVLVLQLRRRRRARAGGRDGGHQK